MKKLLIILFIFIIGLSSYAKQTKINAIPDEQLKSMDNSINTITKKIYGGAFLSPYDTSNLISIKIKLDDAMLTDAEAQYAPLYYKLGKIYQKRGSNMEAIECYQTIIENFPDTALAPMAATQLKKMGISIKLPVKNIESEE